MSAFWIGNICLGLSILCAAGSQVTIKALFNETGPFSLSWSFLEALLPPGRLLRAAVAVVLVGGGFLLWVAGLSRLNVSYAYPIACSSALLVTLFSVLFLGEVVSARMWLGTALIVAGTTLLAPQPGPAAAPAEQATTSAPSGAAR